MKEMVRYGFTLGLICVVASGLLAGVNSLTKARITQQAKAEEEESLREVLPQAARFAAVESQDTVIYYKAYDKEGRFIGVAFRAAGKGYSSTIETMVGLNKKGVITAIKILSQNETPGLGSRVAEESFTRQFKDKNLAEVANVEAITGATISSKAVIDSVKEKAQEILGRMQDEK